MFWRNIECLLERVGPAGIGIGDDEAFFVKTGLAADAEHRLRIPIARYVPGTAADLKVGAKIFVGAAQKQPDGTLSAPNVAVGRDIDPPQ